MTAVVVTRLAIPARRRPTTWLALALLALALGMVGFMWLSMVLPGWEVLGNRPDSAWELATLLTSTLAYVALPTVGATLAALRPENPIGWTMLVSGLGFAFGASAPEYVRRSSVLGANLPATALVDWLGYPLQALAFLLLVIWLPMHFPDGRLAGRRWQLVAWAAELFIGCAGVVLVVRGMGGDIVEILALFINPFLVAFVGLAFSSVMVRFRRSNGIERLQLKWFLAAAGLLAATLIVTVVTGSPRQGPHSFLAFAFLPIAIGIAILRYRLYDIDRLISRTIGWTLVTGILVAVFAGAVIGFQALLADVTQGETLAVAASTLAAFALFQPLRRRIQAAVDRRFDRARYDGQRTVDAFAEELRDKVEFTDIDHDLHRAIHETVRPAHVGVWLRSGGEGAEG